MYNSEHVDLGSGGVSRPTFALIHGLGSSAGAWERVTPLLAEHGLTATPIELPGYGLQAHRDPARTVGAMAAAVDQEIAALGTETIVVGHSMGGLVATALAERRPRWLRAIAVVNTPPTVESRLTARGGTEELIRQPVIGPLAWRAAPRRRLRAGLESAVAPGFAVPDAFVDDLRACSHATFTRSTTAIDTYLAERPLAERLAALDVASTLIFGMQDRRIDASAVAALRAAHGGVCVEIAEAGHTPIWETPRQAADAIAALAATPLPAG